MTPKPMVCRECGETLTEEEAKWGDDICTFCEQELAEQEEEKNDEEA